MTDGQPTILQIIPNLDTGGAELSTIEMTEAIVKAGGRALVLSEGGRLASRIADAGGELVFFPAATKNPLRILWNGHAIAGIVHSEKVSLIHARSRAPAWSALLAARQTHVPFVTTYHGAYSERGRLKNLYNSVMARADAVIANSGYTADLIAKRYATPQGKIVIIHRGVDLKAFDPAGVDREHVARLREAWNVSGEQRIVLHAARLTHWKGQLDVIAAARVLKERFPDTVFILAGDPQRRMGYLGELRTAIEGYGLQDRVRLVGHVYDMPAAFAASAVTVVASSEPEAFGRAAAEAQAMGCPVISTNIGAPPETILAPPASGRDTMTGWLVPPSNPQQLADTIAEALTLDRVARDKMATRSRQHIIVNFSTLNLQLKTLAVYDRLLATSLADRFSRTK